ncbi:MAG: NAD(P)/FAD-dependent oxidoreductase [Epsilonproteobacteria bacterium]|nr:NAD(P)/FAD-dependent oxidoreductase [Campylobacterota bacterium]
MIRVAVIGAGAAGIMASVVASCKSVKVDLYEKNSVIGKKISISGNGKCNISNTDLSMDNFFTANFDFVKSVFDGFGFDSFERFCKRMGLFLDIGDDGKVYPLSYSAKSALEIFKDSLTQNGVDIFLESPIENIEKKGDVFIVASNGKIKEYDKVLLSMGSYAAEHLGGSMTGYEIAKSFGHKIVDIYPSLVQLEVEKSTVCSKISGVKTFAEVTFLQKKKKITIQGDILFTKYGLSGFAILDISPYVSKSLLKSDFAVISVNFLKDYDRVELFGIFNKIKKLYPKREILILLAGFVDIKIAKVLLDEVKIQRENRLEDIGAKDMKKIISKLIDWRFEIKSTHGFRYAEVCGGGVDTMFVDSKTMESKLIKGLYFAGEILDVTGKRGGYNLAFAWSSGYLAGTDIRKGV